MVKKMRQSKQMARGISRREFLKIAGAVVAAAALGELKPLALAQERGNFKTAKEAIEALWDGRLNPTWLKIEGIASGQIQVRKWNSQIQKWDDEFGPTFAWIHRIPESPYDFQGLFFIHRENLDLALKGKQIPPGTRLLIYANWNHDTPVLRATIGVRYVFEAERFDDPSDPLVRQIARSSKTLAIVTCHPPGCEGSGCNQRLVYYAWANLPK